MVPSFSSMGCTPSRSSVAPSDERAHSNSRSGFEFDTNYKVGSTAKDNMPANQVIVENSKTITSSNDLRFGQDEEMKSILLKRREDGKIDSYSSVQNDSKSHRDTKRQEVLTNGSPVASDSSGVVPNDNDTELFIAKISDATVKQDPETSRPNSSEDGTNLDLLRQYIIVDHEIAQLEDRDALRMYHEKIEQLEQLERELDMISSEAEEVAAARGRSDLIKVAEIRQSPSSGAGGAVGESGRTATSSSRNLESENNSVISGTLESMSPSSSPGMGKSKKPRQTRQASSDASGSNKELERQQEDEAKVTNQEVKVTDDELNRASASRLNSSQRGKTPRGRSRLSKNSANQEQLVNTSSSGLARYPTIEEVFNRKIILERERDRLKKEVERVIVECDKLQNRYKKRDEILDKLFDGKKGNGLENHLEQQLNWLLEQKHYVDQVFYAWKRAETLTIQTCDQFATALDLLKRLSSSEVDTSGADYRTLIKNVRELLIKSRQDMDQAQKYNPNVDAPFFTDSETERFDKVIESLKSAPIESLTATNFSQMLTVIQFAHKRAVSIRLWLEQILQTTIARDSFELAEEYKWIAIQLRKERINLIRFKLQESPYRSMARSIHEQLIQQQQLNSSAHQGRIHEQQVNRDSGVESEANDFDFEEEIQRLLVYLCKYMAEISLGASARLKGNTERLRESCAIDSSWSMLHRLTS